MYEDLGLFPVSLNQFTQAPYIRKTLLIRRLPPEMNFAPIILLRHKLKPHRARPTPEWPDCGLRPARRWQTQEYVAGIVLFSPRAINVVTI